PTEEQLAAMRRERNRLGYFDFDDAELRGYTGYDNKTILALARNGDAYAEYSVVSQMHLFPDETRKEIALSSARNGRTFGLFSYGSQVFMFLDPDPMGPVGLPEATEDRLVEGYGMLLTAMRMGDLLPVEEGSSVQIALSELTADQLSAAREYADDLIRQIN
ncbi:MAG: hypothetical protein AAF578_08485, partial [Pseudomonadota bacterium]